MSREWEKQRTQTLLGMSQQETAAHNQAAAQARAQQTAAWGDIASGISSGVTAGMSAGGGAKLSPGETHIPGYGITGQTQETYTP